MLCNIEGNGNGTTPKLIKQLVGILFKIILCQQSIALILDLNFIELRNLISNGIDNLLNSYNQYNPLLPLVCRTYIIGMTAK
jgi:hypothetical protein